MNFRKAISAHFSGPAGIGSLWSIAWPLILVNATYTVMMFVDRLVLSRYSTAALAASSPAGQMAWTFMLFFMETAGYVSVLAAQYRGADRPEQCGLAAWQSLFLAVVSYGAILALMPLGRSIFWHMGHDPQVARLEEIYFSILAYGSIFTLLGWSLANFFVGLGRPRIIFWAHLAGMLTNVPLTYVLVFGKLGAPRLGVGGAALATVISTVVAMAILGMTFLRKEFRWRWGTLSQCRFCWPMTLRLLRFGAASGVEALLSTAGYTFFILLIGRLGMQVQATANAVNTWKATAWMPLWGISSATAVLVGQHMGAGREDLAEQSGYSGLKLANAVGLLTATAFLAFPQLLLRVFLPADSTPPDMRHTGVVLLMLASIHMAADANAMAAFGVLRGSGDTFFAMAVSVALHWLALVLPTWIAIHYLGGGIYSMWICFMGFMILLAATLLARFQSGKWKAISVIAEKPPLPVPPPSAETGAEYTAPPSSST